MSADWIGINSSHLDSHCGDDGEHTIEKALDGTDLWVHGETETHQFTIDLLQTYNVTKVRSRSNTLADPINVNIYVSDDKENWGEAVASGINTWQDRGDWDGNAVIDTTPKEGRYVKVEIIDTESGSDWINYGHTTVPFTIFDVYGEAANGDVTVSPSTLTLALTLQTPSILFPLQTILPSVLALALTQQTPVIVTGIIIEPSTLTLALTLQTPSILFPIQTILPSTLTLASTVLAPTIIIDCTVTPSVLALELTLETPTIATILNATVTPDTLQLLATLHAPDAITFWTDIPPFMQKDLIDPYSGGAWLWLCEIAVSGYDTQRIARNTEDVRYRGEDYDEFNLQIGEQVFSGDGSIPRITLRVFQDINRKIEDIINEAEGALGAEIKLIRVCEKFLDSPVSALEADYDNLAAESDSEWVTFTLGIPNPLTQRFPLRNFSSSVCPWATPSLFKGPECQYSDGDTSCTGTYDDCRTNKNNAVHWGGELGLDPSVVRV